MKKYILYSYYAVLVLILMSWTSITSFPPAAVRLAFGAAVVIPAIMNNNGLLPAALTCFWALTANGYAYSYMPTSEYLYAAIMLIATIIFGRQNDKLKIPSYNVWIIFFFYVLLINIVMQQSVAKISYTVLVVLLFPFFMGTNLKSVIDKFSIAFMVVSIVVSYYAIATHDSILMSQFTAQDDRIAWVDPNYMGMQVGMGAIVGLINLLKYSKIDFIQKILSPVALVSSLPAILLTGSRGAALCIIGGVFILILSNKTKLIYKVLVGLLLAFVVVQLLSEGYFELLLSRVVDDDGTGSGRTDIWKNKINAFFDLNPILWLFGCGSKWGMTLGYGSILGFHNDFVAFLCMYGFIGLSLFLYILFSPLKYMHMQSNGKFEICACVFYSILASITLEPIQSGVIAFYAFMFYTMMKAKYSMYNEE